MKLAELFGKLNRFQQSLGFKIGASILVLLLAIGTLVFYSVKNAKVAAAEPALSLVETAGGATPGAPAGTGADGRPINISSTDQAQAEVRRQAELYIKLFNDLRASRLSLATVTTAVISVACVLLVVIWLNVGLTYFGLLLVGVLAAWPMIAFGSPSVRSFGIFAAGGIALAAAFAALVQGLRFALSGSHPVFAIAKNVVNEAVRMKISLIFIIMLMIVLASLPGLLDPSTPLRYRVQTFLQYSTSGSYFIIAVLVLFLAAASICFEQRDKIIWQTVTKPVAAWQYVLGKWLGVSSLAAILLAVCGTGILLFTEYLRNQPAQGEVMAFVPASGSATSVTEDRMVLEYQVLAGRVSERPQIPPAEDQAVSMDVNSRMKLAEKEYAEDQTRSTTRPDRAKIRLEVEKERLQQFLSIAPAETGTFEFVGLQKARELGKPITLRYKINAGGNLPTDLYRLTFIVRGADPVVREAHLATAIAMPLSAAAISPNGTLTLQISNGDFERRIANRESINFPPDGIELSFPVASFRDNFFRVMLVNWAKLAFLAMVAVMFSTFLAFPVASLTTFGVFICAEGAKFLTEALENFRVTDADNKTVIWWAQIAEWVATPVAGLFRFYADLRPIESIVEGRLLEWSTVLNSGSLMFALTAVLFLTATAIFRSRELATYSGQ